MSPSTVITPSAPVPVVEPAEPGLEQGETCDLCDSLIEAGTAAAVLYYANSHGFAHAECIDLLRLPIGPARLL